MFSEITRSLPEVEMRKETYRRETNSRLENLLGGGAPLKDIADLLDAREFLNYHPAPRGKQPVVTFDAAGFINRETAKKTPLQVPETFVKLPAVIIPPDAGELQKTGSEAGFEKKEIIPRSRFLIEFLSDAKEPYSVIEGTNSPGMIRGLSYRVFILPRMEKIVFINDEEGNATFVVHNEPHPEKSFAQYAALSKEQLKALPDTKISHLIYQRSKEAWLQNMEPLLTASPVSFEELEDLENFSREKNEAPAPLPGWLHSTGILKAAGMVKNTNTLIFLKKALDAQREIHPEWFGFYKSARKVVTYFHPDLVKKVLDQISERKKTSNKASDGMAPVRVLSANEERVPNVTELREEFRVGYHWLAKKIESYQISHPEYFMETPEGLRYTPRLVEALRKDVEIKIKEPAPEGWHTCNWIAKEFNSGFERTSDFLEQFRNDQEMCQIYADERGTAHEHFHPDVIARFMQLQHESLGEAPNGWMNARQIRERFNLDDKALKKLLELHVQAHHVVRALDGRKIPRDYYHPDVIAAIAEDRSRHKKSF